MISRFAIHKTIRIIRILFLGGFMQRNFEQVKINEIEINTLVEGDGKPVIFVHGWPESWYSWRNQIEPFKNAGYKVIIPDIRGYGRSSNPKEVEKYTLKKITKDLIGILDFLNEENAHIIGHDWGAPISWYTSLLYPDRINSVSGLSVPFNPFINIPPTEIFKQLYKNDFFYILYFQKYGVAEKELEFDLDKSLKQIYCNSDFVGMKKRIKLLSEGSSKKKDKNSSFLENEDIPENLPDWLSQEDLNYFVKEFENSGMTGPLNRYRCMDLDWKELKDLSLNKITKPACFITGDLDPVNFFVPGVNLFDSIGENYTDLRKKEIIENVGHWTQQEAPDKVNKILLDFLGKI